MRIAYLTTDFGIPVYGNKGASIHVRELSAALTAQGHQVEIITSRAGGDAPDGFDLPVHEMPLAKPERLLAGLLQDDPSVSEPMGKEIRSMLYSATLRSRALPLLEHFLPDAIYERYALLGTGGVELARALRIPHILEVNAPLSEEHAQYRGSAFGQTIRAVERNVLGAVDHVVSVSRQLRDWIIDTGVSPNRVTVVPNGVNIERFSNIGPEMRAELGMDERPIVGFVGTLKAWHGTVTLIRAVGLLARERGINKAPRLLIVGDGPQREYLVEVAAEEGITALTTFTGTVAHDAVPPYIGAMDIAVAPYDATTNFYFSPLKLFEYMAAGRPVIAASIGQIVECIRDGENGLLYTPSNIPALAQQIARLIDDPDTARALGRAAQEETRTTRSWDHNARIVTGLITSAQRSASFANTTQERGH